MSQSLIHLLAILIFGTTLGILTVRYFFKGSILFYITSFWIATLTFYDALINLKYMYPDIFKLYIIMPVGILVVVFIFRHISIKIKAPLNDTIFNLKKITEGDLTIAVNARNSYNKNELGQLNEATIKLAEHFTTIMKEISQTTKELQEAGTKLNTSAAQMSQASSEQAASLEEVSSSMEEIVSNIQNNASHTVQAEKMAGSTGDNFEQSLHSMEEALSSLNDIAGKINIITDIAFQTNILALNAAVEAARAGEHGKGFAVVAAEVRKLADKSKEAANSIVQAAQKGSSLSNTAQDLMKKSFDEMRNTRQLVQEISSANMEQGSGAEQVNTAIQELNIITQKNASFSEEMVESAESLNNKADELSKLVAFFSI